MRARTAAAIALGLVLIAAGAAFYVSTTSTGTLAVRIQDTPATWSHVVVTFSEVSARPASAPNGTGWRALSLQTTRIDFLSLGNLTRQLALDRLAPGDYAEVRIQVASVSGVLASGTPVAMTVTGGTLLAGTPFTLRGGMTTTVTLEIDLAASIVQTGAGWAFTPVLGPVEIS